MIERIGEIELTDEYWDCECEKNYIHPREQGFCVICKTERESQPDSRVEEVLSHGLFISELGYLE